MLNVMITLFCVLTILGLNHCDDLPSKIDIETSINRTVDEVEKLIHQNSTLPHLSRHDIVDILFNITSKELETYDDKDSMEEARKIYQRALMVVLPYNAKDAKENINELYTKPPIVHIITDPSSNPEDLRTWRNKKLEPYTPVQETHHKEEPLENLVVTHASERTIKTRYKNHKETYSDMETKKSPKGTVKIDSAPIKFSFNLENLQKQSTERPELTRRPVYHRPSSDLVKDENVSIIYSTSAGTRTTMNSKDVSTIRVKETQTATTPRSRYSGNVLSVDQWRYNAPTSATENPITSPKASDSSSSTVREKLPLLPTVKMSPDDLVAPTMISKPKNTSQILKVTSGKMQVANTPNKSASIYVTPMSSSSPSSSSPSSGSFNSSSSSSSERPKYSATYNLNSGGFRTITTTTTTTTTTTSTMRPEVMDLLASIGLRPENTTNVEEVFKKSNIDLEINSRIPDSGGVIHSMTSDLAAANSPSIVAQNAFENPVSEIGKGMNNLTPDIQLLFQRFGLHTSGNTIATSTTTSTPRSTTRASTNSYTNFKPLPTSKIKDEEMKEFLARFGLGINEGVRQKKSMPVSTERPSLIEAVPGSMRRILENIGLISRTTPKTTTTTTTTTTTRTAPKMENVKPTDLTKFHVFKPHEVQVKDERQRMKINELLDTIRLVQDGKANATDVRRVANELLATTKTLREGPDPARLEEIIKIYNEDVKNEVKRQQDPSEITSTTIINTISDPDVVPDTTSIFTESVDASSTTTSTTTTATMTTTTTVSPMPSDSAKDGSELLDALLTSSTTAGTNLVALEESFGGTTSAPDPVLPTRRKSGLYFLVDWNTFLEVGEDNNEKVNLRFQPKVGDRSRFLPITVP